ncbi:substrate-binding periplasmic protein [Bacillus sp. UNC438CL73TsuS30]|uniref:substrate-binding periplasmic protein n=1 Tax=Bacillus sp. UNC438CL73TsuS30 TaxID=1340434 RepID=UPI00047CB4AF|nr:ABC transporter substrate-binding protein [Bacillus sp. UNC438CL73TsuS30]
MSAKKSFVTLFILVFALVGLVGCGSNEKTTSGNKKDPSNSGSQIKTVESGYLNVAIIGDMPMTAVENGKIIGTDGDLIHKVAEKLNLKVRPQLMQWPAPIEAVRTGRADIAIGNIFWTPERSKVMLMTDPVYYASSMIVQQQSKKDVKNIAELKGHKVGTVTGFAFVPDLQKLESEGKIASVTTYKDNNALIQDLKIGRVDIGFVDPPTGAYVIKQNPSYNLKVVTFTDSDKNYSVLGKQFQTAWCVNPKEKELYDAINKEVQEMWKTGLNKEMLSKYGLDQDGWFIPDGNPRAGADRSNEWTPPTLAGK